MNLILLLLIAVLVVLVALLWYGLRTRKTVAQLEQKLDTGLKGKLDAFKAEATEATEAAKAKL